MKPMETGPRVLLKRLREVMAESLGAQVKLDKIVDHIAANMVAEVCSVYILRTNDILELYATKGLNPEAVHEVSLKVGEGLVGTIAASARPLNIQDAQKHPLFALLPETGEESFSSFMGVPILRAGRSLGVLVVQNKDKRVYRDDEIEALETTAMVLAELIAAGELKGLGSTSSELDINRPRTIRGSSFAKGIGVGNVVLHAPRVVVTNLFNEDFEVEKQRLSDALDKLRISIDNMLERNELLQHGETREVLDTYRMFANDEGWVRRMREAVRNGLTAEAAVEKVQSDHQARMQRVSDPYIRDRMSDFDDLAYRLLRELVGEDQNAKILNPSGKSEKGGNKQRKLIVVARNMAAAELLDYSKENLGGLILEDGGAASHVVIVAKALGIPVVGRAAGIISSVENGDEVIVDGQEGVAYLRPGGDIKLSYSDKIHFQAERQRKYEKLRDFSAVTVDGMKIKLQMNAGLLVDLPQLAPSGADGIGLFRTELQFMVSASFPRPGQQEELYRQVLDEAKDLPVTFRTLDVGGDKVLPYLRSVHEENPALGWRAVRLALDRPGLLKSQIRALLKAASGRELRLMLPMVTEVHEIRRARVIIDHEIEVLKRFGYQLPENFKFGAMIEVPSILYQLDEVMNTVDFISVGSNDLFQFMMASDRGNNIIADRFDPVSRPFARALKIIAQSAIRHKKEFSLCGDFAERPMGALVLFALGYQSVSMSAASIGPIKSMIRNLDIGKLREILLPAIDEVDGGQTLRELLKDFVDSNGITY
ncbi:MAG: phosphoenolpyruvate--protein phosphotransferase [Hyphomicrobiales bacterium]|nr:phosphoenolpyruvate--protein phosphotransferase [Hyphomicrobiales bacterium]